MISANIATLKAKLSFYLSQVRKGQEVLVFDRKTLIAKIVSSEEAGQGLVIEAATKDPRALKDMKFRPVRRKTDVVRLLREERDRR